MYDKAELAALSLHDSELVERDDAVEKQRDGPDIAIKSKAVSQTLVSIDSLGATSLYSFSLVSLG